MEFRDTLVIKADVAIFDTADEGQILRQLNRRAVVQGYESSTHNNPAGPGHTVHDVMIMAYPLKRSVPSRKAIRCE